LPVTRPAVAERVGLGRLLERERPIDVRAQLAGVGQQRQRLERGAFRLDQDPVNPLALLGPGGGDRPSGTPLPAHLDQPARRSRSTVSERIP